MRPPRPLNSAIIVPALVVSVLVLCLACAQTTPVYQVGAPPEGTPVTSTEAQSAQPASGSAVNPTPVYHVGAPSDATPVTSTEAQAAQPSPVSDVPELTGFEDFLSGETLAKYKSLPVEFQDALREEAAVSGYEKAIQYLHDLPDDAVPISELLEGWVLGTFEHLDSSYQRLLLLEGYPNSTNTWLKGDVTEEEARFGDFDEMVMTLWDIVSGDGEVLPPIEDTLSPEALAKLDSIDPVMRQSFRLIWESTRTLSPAELAEELEQDLLAAPADLPVIEDMGLSAEAVELLNDMPDLKALVQQKVATDVLRTQKWDEEYIAVIEHFLSPYYTQEGKARFARGLTPYVMSGFDPLICQPSLTPQMGIALPTWAIPAPFRDVSWTHLMFRWPDYEQALSEEALSRLRSMDPVMQRTFEKFWYGTGPMPKEAGEMACSVAQWECGLIYAPFTSLPAPEELLSPEGLELYRSLTPPLQKELWDQEVYLILKSGIVWNPTTEEAVPIYGTSLEEILEVLKVWSEHSVRSLSERISNTE